VVPNHIAFIDATGKTITFEELGSADVTGDFDNIFEFELCEPVAVLFDGDEIEVDYFTNLLFPGFDIGVDFLLSD